MNENNRLLIFYFHGLYETNVQKEFNHVDPQNNISVPQFTEFVDYFLLHKYIFIKPEDLLSDLPNNKSYIMITFDDGYFNNMLAIEVLKKYNIPATIFVTTKNIFENKSYWWDIIYKYRTKELVSLESIRKEQAYLKNLKYQFIEEYIVQNFGIDSFEPWSDIDRPLNKSELLTIYKNPNISIRNHTHNHAILTNYTDEEIENEFAISNKLLYNLTGSNPASMAFPNGNHNDLLLKLSANAGFKFAFTTQSGINKLPISNDSGIMSLNRFMMKTSKITGFGSFARLNYSAFRPNKHTACVARTR